MEFCKSTVEWFDVNHHDYPALQGCNMLLCNASGEIYIGYLDDFGFQTRDGSADPLIDIIAWAALPVVEYRIGSIITNDQWVTNLAKQNLL